MAGDYDNELRGALWENGYKKADTHPDYKGTCQIEGVVYEVAMWEGKGDGRAPVFRLRFENKADADAARPARQGRERDRPASSAPRQGRKPAPRQVDAIDEDLNDDIPFAWAVALPLISALTMFGGGLPIAYRIL